MGSMGSPLLERQRGTGGLMLSGILSRTVVAVAAISFWFLPGAALAAAMSTEPYTKASLWIAAVAYAALFLIVVTIAFRKRFSRRVGGTSVHDRIWRQYRERQRRSDAGGPQS